MKVLCLRKSNGIRLANAFCANKTLVNRIARRWNYVIPDRSWEAVLRLGYAKAFDELYKLKHFQVLSEQSISDPNKMAAVSRMLDAMLERLLLRVKLDDARRDYKGVYENYGAKQH